MKINLRQLGREESKNDKRLCFSVCALLLAFSFPAQAQKPERVARIGFLGASSSSAVADRTEAFRQGLRELGYIEGKNIVIDWRYADGKGDRLPVFAAELVRLNPDVIVTQGSTSTRVAQKATRAVPIVMAAAADPVAEGMIASLARPGGNITGLSSVAPQLSGKRLELLKEVVPRASRVAVIFNPGNIGSAPRWKEMELAARELGVKLQPAELRPAEYFEKVFEAVKKEGAHALIVFRLAFVTMHRDQVVKLVAENRLPAIYEQRDYVQAGGLMSYDPSQLEIYRRAAYYVDRIVRGAQPADLPVEQPTKFELVINLKTAKQIGLTIPPNVLARADKVIR